MNMGEIYENFVAQELVAHGFEPRYFSGKKTREIDFLLEGRDGVVTALKVKSANNYRSHAALTKALGTKNYDISHAFVLAETNVNTEDDISYFPIYMASQLRND